MCGIVGYLGDKDPKDVLLGGLKRLEYRGYDSAGVAIHDGTTFKRVRASGKLSALEEKLSNESFSGRIGIGHTRWATHGEPSERNAHPHKVGPVTLVHNGIIENFHEIKEDLKSRGAQLASDTDTELVAHLLNEEYQVTKDLRKAVERLIPLIRGAYSIVAVSEDQPNKLVAFKEGPPLVVGSSRKEVIIASDVQAILDHVQEVVYLEDDEVVEVDGTDVKFFSANGFPIRKESVKISWSADQMEKHGYKNFMLKEIFEQPRAVAAAIDPHIDLNNYRVALNRVGFGVDSVEKLDSLNFEDDLKNTIEKLSGIERIFIVACGTSFYAGMVGEYLLESFAEIPVEVDIASEFRYRDPVIPKNSLVIVVSQSGETADSLAVLRQVKELGALTLSICNVKRSSIDRESDGHLYMNAGVEIGVASTKAFVSTLSVFHLFSVFLGRVRGKLTEAQEQEYTQSLVAVPSLMESVLVYDNFFAEVAKTLKTFRGFLYMGRGVNYPIAMEGALKLKELAYMHAEGYAAGEMKHGPLALIDDRMIVMMMVPSDKHYEKSVSNLQEAKARGGVVISLGTGENTELKEMSEHYLSLPKAHWSVNPILEAIPVQLLAYHVADALGHDVDQPRNLAKSVTVE